MNIFLGTTSEQKINIVKNVLSKKHIESDITPTEVDSSIDNQPLSEEITIQGSINKARDAIQKNGNIYDISVGMEGGLVLVNDVYNLVCAVSIVDKENRVYTGISKKISLPKKVSERIKNGEQFGVVIREFEKELIDKNEEVSNVIQELIERKQSFFEAFAYALFQYNNKTFF